jgi:hypothetical protein
VKTILGGMFLVLGLLAAGGLFWSLGRLAWFPGAELNGPVAFFGFGIPMVLFGGTAYGFWHKDRRLLKCLGWVCTALGFVWALGLLALVAGWVGLLPGAPGKGAGWPELVGLFLEFFVPMLVCGGAGLGIVVAEDEKAFRTAAARGGAAGLGVVMVLVVAGLSIFANGGFLWLNESTPREPAQKDPEKHRAEIQKTASDKYKDYVVGKWQLSGGGHDGETIEFTKAGNVVVTSKANWRGAVSVTRGAYGFKHENWPDNADVWLYPDPQNSWLDCSVFYQIERVGDDEMKLERVLYYHDSPFSTFTGSKFRRLKDGD